MSAWSGELIEVTEILNRFLDCYLGAGAKYTPSGTLGYDCDSLRSDNSLESGYCIRSALHFRHGQIHDHFRAEHAGYRGRNLLPFVVCTV